MLIVGKSVDVPKHVNPVSESFRLPSNQEEIAKIQELEKDIATKDWKHAEQTIKNYFLPRKIDLFPTFHSIRKTLPKESLNHFESLVSLLPLDSAHIQK